MLLPYHHTTTNTHTHYPYSFIVFLSVEVYFLIEAQKAASNPKPLP